MNDRSSSLCPSLDEIEQFAIGSAGSTPVGDHVRNCSTCRDSVARIRANNDLLREFRHVQLNDTPKVNESSPLVVSIPGYEIRSEIRRGGQGVIYRAVQKATRREVALKTLLAGRWASERQRLRFEREIELVASLRHPRIVTLYDSGPTSDGGHYFAMEFIDGVPLDQFLKKTNASPSNHSTGKGPSDHPATLDRHTIDNRLRLFSKICEAVQYAHQRGVIHRDLKPANILVDADGEPHILDFGVARSTITASDRSSYATTRAGEFMGTFAYAAPEQVSGDPEQVDTRTDVYALGVILYEMVTGIPPYDSEGSLSDVVHNITEIDPPPPSERQADINDELDTIVLKALAKEKDRRYPSAESLKRDVERYLAGEPIDAKRDSTWYVLRKLARRHRAAVAVAASFVIVVGLFGLSMLLLANLARSERDRANDIAGSLRRTVNALQIERARAMSAIGDTGASEEAVWAAHLNPPPHWEDHEGQELVGEAGPIPSYWALWEHYSRAPALASWNVGALGMLTFSGDGRLACMAGEDEVTLIDLERRERIRSFAGGRGIRQSGLSYDGRLLATTHDDGSILIRSTLSGAVERTISGNAVVPSQPIFNRSASRLAVCVPSREVRVLDLSNGRNILTVPGESQEGPYAGFSGDDRKLVVGYRDQMEIWDLESRMRERSYAGPNPVARFFDFCPDNQTVAAAFNTIVMVAFLADDSTWSYVHGSRLSCVRFSPDGRYLVSIGADGVVKLANVATRQVERTYSSSQRFGAAAAFAPDGRSVYAAHSDGTIRQWETTWRGHIRPLSTNQRTMLNVEFSPDGALLACAGGDRHQAPATYVIDLLDGASGALVRRLEGHESTVSSLAFSADGRLLGSTSYDGTARLWNVTTGECVQTLIGHEGIVSSVAISRDGAIVATGGSDDDIRLWDAVTGTPHGVLSGHAGRVPKLRFSPIDNTLASCGSDGKVILWDIESRRPRQIMAESNDVLRAIAFSPDGATLAAAGDDRFIRLWDVRTGRRLARWEAHSHDIFALSFHRDGRLLASAGRGPGIKLWDVRSQWSLTVLEGHEAEVFHLNFHPNGRMLASCGADRTLMLWDLTYYNRHIAGNLEYHIQRLSPGDVDAESVQRMRSWAASVLAREAQATPK